VNIQEVIKELLIGDKKEEKSLVLWVVSGGTEIPLTYTPLEETKPCGFTAKVGGYNVGYK